MKKIYYLLLALFIFTIPSLCWGLSIYELEPNTKYNVNDVNYKINKTISSKNVTITFKDNENFSKYSWIFDKEYLDKDIDFDLGISFDSPNAIVIDKVTDGIEKTYVSFNYHGLLPNNTKVTIYVGDKYKDNDNLYLYYYDADKNDIELMDSNILVNNGYINFDIEHCSDYFVTATIVNKPQEQSKNINYVIVGLITIVVVLVGITIFKNKK